jgi:hypothetical protein
MTWFVVGSFDDEMRKFERKTARKLELAARKVALELFKRVIEKTPVDKGRARSNWQASIGLPAAGTVETTDKTKTGAPTFRTAVSDSKGFEVGDTIYLANNLPYIRKLEEGGYPDGPKTVGGFSRKAAAGMVALSVQEFSAIVDKISAEMSKQ